MKKQQERNRPVTWLLFGAYCVGMLYLLFVRGRTVQSELPYWEKLLQSYNVQPFFTVFNYWDILTRPEYYIEKFGTFAFYKEQAVSAVVNLVGNVIMFVPLGCFLPACFRSRRKAFRTALSALCILLAVELGQLFSLRGYCDIDDLILNMAGVMAGYGIWWLCSGRHRKK